MSESARECEIRREHERVLQSVSERNVESARGMQRERERVREREREGEGEGGREIQRVRESVRECKRV